MKTGEYEKQDAIHKFIVSAGGAMILYSIIIAVASEFILNGEPPKVITAILSFVLGALTSYYVIYRRG